MREIKFRAWDKKQKAFINGFNMIGFSTGQGAPNKKLQRFSDYWNLDDIELMQFTGLHDKNDKEIYEGDIITHTYESKDGIRTKVFDVAYDLGCFYCKEQGGYFSSSVGYYTTLVKGNSLEVIGNIYENPDLLKEDNHAV